jgi:hypothetical protein
MSRRLLTSMGSLSVIIAAAFVLPAPVSGETWTVPRTADGQPDLQGVWDYRTITPMERPVSLGTKEFFTEEEAANFEKAENQRQNRDLIDPEVGGLMYPPGGVVLVRPRQQGRRHEAHVVDHRSAQRPPSRDDARGQEAGGAARR